MFDDLYTQLFAAKSGEEIRKILQRLGDFPKEVVLGEVFGDRFAWLAVGNRTTNVSTIELATHPGRSLVERINNAIDALVESGLRTSKKKATLKSPADAAALCFGRPAEMEKQVEWFESFQADEEAQRLSVIVSDGASREEPRVDIIDSGVGIHAKDFGQTILGLNVENKIKILYALGLFGQGGSSSLAFANCALILSRSVENPGTVAFTVVRRCEIKGWKESCYAYLAIRDDHGQFQVPTLTMAAATPIVYPLTGTKNIDSKLPKLLHGTLVRHIDYKLPNMANSLSSSQRNLYHALHYLLFDPMIPFRLTDLRAGQLDTRHVSGSRNRLQKLVLKSKEKSGDSRVELKHHRAKEFIAAPGTSDPCIGVEYWVPFCWRKEKDGDYVLRSGTEQYADRDHPILFTYNGQDHGEMTADPLRKIGLNLLCRHIVVNIDATGVDGSTKRELFSSTRENLKKSVVLDGIVERLQQMMSEDTRLYELEKELTDRALAGATNKASGEVKEQVIKMLKEKGLQVGTRLGIGPAGGRTGGGGHQKLPPLPTLPFPQVTRFDVVSPLDGTLAHIDESKSINIETDGDEQFDLRGLIQCRCEPELMEITHKTPLRRGRMSWRFLPKRSAKVGEKGKIVATLCVPTADGTKETFRQEIRFEIAAARPHRRKLVLIPDLEIIPISPLDAGMRPTWTALWPDVDPDDGKAAQAVAYKLFKNSRMIVYYNIDFPPYRAFIDKWKTELPAKCNLFDDAYKTFVAFHAVMQSLSARTTPIELDLLDKITEEERVFTATMVAKQAEIIAELRHQSVVAHA